MATEKTTGALQSVVPSTENPLLSGSPKSVIAFGSKQALPVSQQQSSRVISIIGHPKTFLVLPKSNVAQSSTTSSVRIRLPKSVTTESGAAAAGPVNQVPLPVSSEDSNSIHVPISSLVKSGGASLSIPASALATGPEAIALPDKLKLDGRNSSKLLRVFTVGSKTVTGKPVNSSVIVYPVSTVSPSTQPKLLMSTFKSSCLATSAVSGTVLSTLASNSSTTVTTLSSKALPICAVTAAPSSMSEVELKGISTNANINAEIPTISKPGVTTAMTKSMEPGSDTLIPIPVQLFHNAATFGKPFACSSGLPVSTCSSTLKSFHSKKKNIGQCIISLPPASKPVTSKSSKTAEHKVCITSKTYGQTMPIASKQFERRVMSGNIFDSNDAVPVKEKSDRTVLATENVSSDLPSTCIQRVFPARKRRKRRKRLFTRIKGLCRNDYYLKKGIINDKNLLRSIGAKRHVRKNVIQLDNNVEESTSKTAGQNRIDESQENPLSIQISSVCSLLQSEGNGTRVGGSDIPASKAESCSKDLEKSFTNGILATQGQENIGVKDGGFEQIVPVRDYISLKYVQTESWKRSINKHRKIKKQQMLGMLEKCRSCAVVLLKLKLDEKKMVNVKDMQSIFGIKMHCFPDCRQKQVQKCERWLEDMRANTKQLVKAMFHKITNQRKILHPGIAPVVPPLGADVIQRNLKCPSRVLLKKELRLPSQQFKKAKCYLLQFDNKQVLLPVVDSLLKSRAYVMDKIQDQDVIQKVARSILRTPAPNFLQDLHSKPLKYAKRGRPSNFERARNLYRRTLLENMNMLSSS